jgi:hypothetical protein
MTHAFGSRRELALAIALLVLALLQLAHLLDDLRTDPSATLLAELLKPQAIAGVGGALLAAGLVLGGHRIRRTLAIAVASLVALGFVLVHALPFKAGPLHPYWAVGSADALQWAGVVSIWACCAVVFVLARRIIPSAPSW